MKIGDRVFVRGYIDEIRKDTVIVRNDGGYFGTVLSEVTGELPSAQPEPCEDCVSRKVIMQHYDSGEYKHVNHISRNGLLDYIEQLPPAQPEKHTENTRKTHACDLIDRQAAIDAIEEMQMPIMRSMFPEEQFVFKGMSEALSAIKDLPSAQPEMIREIRKWINSGNRGNADYFIVEKIEEIINKYE